MAVASLLKHVSAMTALLTLTACGANTAHHADVSAEQRARSERISAWRDVRSECVLTKRAGSGLSSYGLYDCTDSCYLVNSADVTEIDCSEIRDSDDATAPSTPMCTWGYCPKSNNEGDDDNEN